MDEFGKNNETNAKPIRGAPRADARAAAFPMRLMAVIFTARGPQPRLSPVSWQVLMESWR